MSISPAAAVLAAMDRPCWIVTAQAGPRRGGLLATWVHETSIDPDDPHLLVGLAQQHFTAELVAASGAFVAHLLRPDQAALGLGFALGSGRDRDKLAGLSLDDSAPGGPVLADCAAWMSCRVVERNVVDDRAYVWGQVIAAAEQAPPPWLMASQLFAAATSEELATLRANLEQDIAHLRRLRRERPRK